MWHGLPLARDGCCLPPDAVGYIATAHNWLEGAGFVDPILYSHYLSDARPPIPAFATRPPGVSLLLVPILALGAHVGELLVWQVAWAALIAAAAVLAARRSMSLPAATAFAIAATWSPIWMLLSPTPLTEVSAVGILIAAIAFLRAGTASTFGALLLALLTLVGWMVRPNLGLILPAVLLAVACERGPRAAFRHRPLWVYVGAFALLHRAAVFAVTAATGFAPYAHYGVMLEIIDTSDVFLYGKEYVGWLAYLDGNRDAILEAVGHNARQMVRVLFVEDHYLWVGWFGAPGVAFALWQPGPGALERRFAAFAALGFTAVAVASYGGFDEMRYPLLGVVCAWYATLSMFDAAAESWVDGGVRRAALRGLPLLAVLALYGLQDGAGSFWNAWRGWQAESDRYRPFCGLIDSDALVASENPWWFYLSCGNAGYRIPVDLARGDTLDRYLDDQRPGYLLVRAGREWGFLKRSPRLRGITALNGFVLLEFLDSAPRARPWRAPPPLLSAPEAPSSSLTDSP